MSKPEQRDWALVTGGSRGIGRAICEAAAARDLHVVVNFLSNEEQACAVVDAIRSNGGSAETRRFDVGDQASYDRWIRSRLQRMIARVHEHRTRLTVHHHLLAVPEQ